MSYPNQIRISHDDYLTKHIGRLADGSQFFLTTPFEAESGSNQGCEYVALYIFNDEGVLVDAQIETLGPRNELMPDQAESVYDVFLSNLGSFDLGDIQIGPFSIEKDGVKFGLIPNDPELEGDANDLALEMHPGKYISFFPPWTGEHQNRE